MKIMTVFGTRPEIIRLSMILKEIDRKGFEHVMVNTNQNPNYNMNKLFLEELEIRDPNYNLNVRTDSLGNEIADIINKSDEILSKEKPDVLLILGDTHSGLSAIPAAHRDIKIAHVEAGMRSFDLRVPEEKNRKLIDHLSSVLFPYTEYSRQNLIREGVHPSKIYVVGNPIRDVLDHFQNKIRKNDILKRLGLREREYFLVTAHRKENVDDRESLLKILKSLELLSEKYNKKIVYPIHPRTKSRIIDIKISKNIMLIEPLGFLEFTNLEMNASCILTDSGTVEEEACYFNVPCVTVRLSTEKHETVKLGSNILSGLDPKNVIDSVHAAMNTKQDWTDHSKLEIFGDGKASIRVVNILRGVF